MTCRVCDGKTDTYLCGRCLGEIERSLGDLPADLEDLEAVATRQASGPLGLGGHYCGRTDRTGPWEAVEAPTDEPWVFAPGAADQIWAVGNTVTTWARHLAESRGLELPVKDTLGAIYWLLANLDAVRFDEAAGQIHDEITSLPAENARWIVGTRSLEQFYGVCDAPDVRVRLERPRHAPIGPRCYGLTSCGHDSCDAIRDAERNPVLTPRLAHCGADLYGDPDASEVRCRACGRRYATKDRRDSLRAALPDQLGTIPEVAAALAQLDRPVHVEALNSAVRRGQIAVRGYGCRRERLVRVGDVEAWLAERAAKRRSVA